MNQKQHRTITNNVFADIGDSNAEAVQPVAPVHTETATPKPKPAKPTKVKQEKVQHNFYLSAEISKKLKAAAYWLDETQADIVSSAISKHLDQLEKREGKEFPVRKAA